MKHIEFLKKCQNHWTLMPSRHPCHTAYIAGPQRFHPVGTPPRPAWFRALTIPKERNQDTNL
jgi:hypothetical protein